MKEDLLKYKEELEIAQGKEKKYFIFPLTTYIEWKEKNLNKKFNTMEERINSIFEPFNKTISIKQNPNNKSVPVEDQCEELMKKIIKYSVENDISLNTIELKGDVYALIDSTIMKRLNDKKNAVLTAIGTINITQAYNNLWQYLKDAIQAYMSLEYFYVELSISDNTGLWKNNGNILHSLETDKIKLPTEIEDTKISGIINFEEFVSTMEERGYNSFLNTHSGRSDNEIVNFISYFNCDSIPMYVRANLALKGNKRRLK